MQELLGLGRLTTVQKLELIQKLHAELQSARTELERAAVGVYELAGVVLRLFWPNFSRSAVPNCFPNIVASNSSGSCRVRHSHDFPPQPAASANRTKRLIQFPLRSSGCTLDTANSDTDLRLYAEYDAAGPLSPPDQRWIGWFGFMQHSRGDSDPALRRT